MGVGFYVSGVAVALLFLELIVVGVQLARGKWARVLAGSSKMSDDELHIAVPPQANRMIGVILVLLSLVLGAFALWSVLGTYTPGNDVIFLVTGVFVLLIDVGTAWVFTVSLHENERR